ncbi:hypothetical protein NKG94_16555 [Micromonospora sp. M12]
MLRLGVQRGGGPGGSSAAAAGGPGRRDRNGPPLAGDLGSLGGIAVRNWRCTACVSKALSRTGRPWPSAGSAAAPWRWDRRRTGVGARRAASDTGG